MNFNSHWMPARKDLLHFIEEHAQIDVLKEIGKKPREWLEEFNIINVMLTGEGLVAGIGINEPPLRDPAFQSLGEGVCLYRGNNRQQRGLWIRKKQGEKVQSDERFNWTHYKLGTTARLQVNSTYSEIPIDSFLPESFEQKGARVEKDHAQDKRPIWRFEAQFQGRPLGIYSKGAYVNCAYYYSDAKPLYRITSLSNIIGVTSKKEMEKAILLEEKGVKVPEIIGIYHSSVENFLFTREVQGKTMDKCINEKNRQTLIEQDATMLAHLCQAGMRKVGFTNGDDKVFDGKTLWLIDVEECTDLYHPGAPDYRKILLDPCNTSQLKGFRRLQRETFKTTLRDALYHYQDNLTPQNDHRRFYVTTFYDALKWKSPKEREMQRLTTFVKDYMTFDTWMSEMSSD
ncbi:MAG: hypothetical protein AABY00_03100 [Nanoarchaeota archaeon]